MAGFPPAPLGVPPIGLPPMPPPVGFPYGAPPHPYPINPALLPLENQIKQQEEENKRLEQELQKLS